MNWYKKMQIYSADFNLSKKKDEDYDSKQLDIGIKIELEHNNSLEIAKSITKDHLDEFPNYYTKLKDMEDKLEDKKD